MTSQTKLARPVAQFERLHAISDTMDIGFTKFVPEEQTRNFCARVLEPDSLTCRVRESPQPSMCAGGSLGLPLSLSQKELDTCEKLLDLASLSHKNYRSLDWGLFPTQKSGEYDVFTPSQQVQEGNLVAVRSSLQTDEKKGPQDKSLEIGDVEARARTLNSISFVFHPEAGPMDRFVSISQHAQRIYNQLNLNALRLNDPIFFNWLIDHTNIVWSSRQEMQELKLISQAVSGGPLKRREYFNRQQQRLTAQHAVRMDTHACPWRRQLNKKTGQCEMKLQQLPPLNLRARATPAHSSFASATPMKLSKNTSKAKRKLVGGGSEFKYFDSSDSTLTDEFSPKALLPGRSVTIKPKKNDLSILSEHSVDADDLADQTNVTAVNLDVQSNKSRDSILSGNGIGPTAKLNRSKQVKSMYDEAENLIKNIGGLLNIRGRQ